MQNLEEGLRWLDQAKADLKTAKDCLTDKNYYASAFFSQQSAEKSLKGYLYAKGFRAIITHSVTELLEECSKHEKVFGKLLIKERSLTGITLALDIPTSILRVQPTNTIRRRLRKNAQTMQS